MFKYHLSILNNPYHALSFSISNLNICHLNFVIQEFNKDENL